MKIHDDERANDSSFLKKELYMLIKKNVENSEKMKEEKWVPSAKYNHDYSQSFSEKWFYLPAQSQFSTTTEDPSML